MFLRKTERRKNGKTHLYWSVVESKRLGSGRVIQRHVLYLGEINSSQAEAWRKAIEVFDAVDGGLNPRLSGAALKTGTKFAANSWRPECGAMDPCQRRKPPEAVAKGQRLQGSVAR